MALAPWGANPPDADTLRELVRQGKSDPQIAAEYGVTRQAVAYWRKKEHIAPHGGSPAPHLTHKKYLPWTLVTKHANKWPAKILRIHSTIQQGGEVSDEDRRNVERFLAFIKSEGRVVDYSREGGFTLVKRDPKLDRRGDIIRRPPPEDK